MCVCISECLCVCVSVCVFDKGKSVCFSDQY